MKTMTYRKAEDYLFVRRAKDMKLGLKNMQDLVDLLNHPERQFPSVHIAGTNGKGSTAAILESILRQAGYRTGLYISPHLIDMRERITIRGKCIPKKKLVAMLENMIPSIEATDASFFEIFTAMSFLYFAEQKVDIGVMETGLGGRLDATNVFLPELCMITDIGLDHTHILGHRLETIAREKAGIFKPSIPCLVGSEHSRVNRIFCEHAQKQNVPLTFLKDSVQVSRITLSENGSTFDFESENHSLQNLYIRLPGEHQIKNSALALLAVEALQKKGWKIPDTAIRRGLKKVVWRARMELLQKNPKILLDSAHNPLGMKQLVKTLKTLFTYNRLILVFGVLADKDYRKMFPQIARLADRIILTRPLNDRALEPERLLLFPTASEKPTEVIPDIPLAWERAMALAQKEDLVCGTGSIYLVGELLRLWKYRNRISQKGKDNTRKKSKVRKRPTFKY